MMNEWMRFRPAPNIDPRDFKILGTPFKIYLLHFKIKNLEVLSKASLQDFTFVHPD